VFVLRGESQGRPQEGRASSKRAALPLARWVVGSEKELGFERGRVLVGKARGEDAPQKRVYKHALERTGVRSVIRAVKTFGTRLRFCLVPQGIRSAWLKCRVDMRKLTGQRHDGRRLGSFLHSLSSTTKERSLSRGGGRWDDPGQAGETVFAYGRIVHEAAAVGRRGTDPMVPEDDMRRQRTGRFR